MAFFDPADWGDVFVNLLIFLAIVVPAYFAYRKLSNNVRETKDQVKNNHTETNLRDDIDRVLLGVNDLRSELRGIRQDISDLRDDIREERDERSELERRIQKFGRTTHPELGPI